MPCALTELFLTQVSRRGNEVALQTTSEAISFSELHSRAVTIKEIIERRRRCVPQRRPAAFSVAIACGTAQTAEICAVLAVVLSGGYFVPLDENLPLPRCRQVVQDAQPDIIILSHSSSGSQASAWRDRFEAIFDVGRRQGCQLLVLEDGGQPVNTHGDEARGGGRRVEVGDAPSSADILSSTADPFGTNKWPLSAVQVRPGRCEEEQLASSEGGAPGGHSESAVAKPAGYSAVPDDGDQLYILYTSGTTGMPKGVRGTRSGALNRIRFGWSLCPYRNKGEIVCRRTPSCFVDFVAEVFCPLLAGVPIFLPDFRAHADPLLLVPALANAKASRITLTPSLLASILRTTCSDPLLPDLHTWHVSGEALHPDLALLFRRRVSSEAQLVNLYGSTEVSGDATYCTLDDIADAERDRSSFTAGVLIGKPLPGIHLLVVGPDLLPVPSGQPGELLVGGVGVALGYHRRPQETRDTFLHSAAHNPGREGNNVVHIPGLEPGHRVVRTRDRVVQPQTGGPLFWLGKLDGEVKVRGARVSLEEVEVLACRAAGLSTGSFAVAFDPGADTFSVSAPPTIVSTSPDRGRLWGFFKPDRAQFLKKGDALAELRVQLSEMLTPAQLPAVLIPVDGGFPLTTSGKVDRRALLSKYRGHAVELVSEQQVTGAKITDVLQPVDPRAENTGAHARARKAVAQAVAAVLPNAQACIAAWLSQTREGAGEGGKFSGLTFEEMGGTSLLAVEAAWRTSNNAVLVGMGPATESLPPSCRLTAEDFLGGTLDDTVSILDGILHTTSSAAVGKGTVPGKAINGSIFGTATTDDDPENCSAALGGPVSPSPLASSAAATALPGASPARRKRRFEETGNRYELVRSRSFFAAGRAGSGFRHTLACLGVDDTGIGQSRGVQKPRVELEIRWSSCMSKCIDATPLVFLPKPSRTVVDPVRSGYTDETPGVTEKASTQSTAPECFCGSNFPSDARASKVRKGKECGSSARRNPSASPTACQQGSVYIGSHSGEFQALDLLTGKLEWSFTAGGRIESGAACSLDGRNVFVGCHDGRLYAIDRCSGILSWSFETADAIKCTPVCVPSGPSNVLVTGEVLPEDEGTVLVGSHDGILRSLRETDGRLLWSFDCSGTLFASVAHDSAARVIYAATTKGRVVALDSGRLVSGGVEAVGSAGNSGSNQPTIVWDTHLPAPCFSTPAVCDASGNVVLGCVDGGLYCLSSAGEQIWVCRREKPVFSSPCLLPSLSKEPGGNRDHGGTQIVWGCHDGVVPCRTGADPLWETDIGRGQPVFSSPCFAGVGCEGCAVRCPFIFACSVPGSIVVLCLFSGAVVGEKQLPGEIFSSPVAAGQDLVVGCRDNRVYLLRVKVKCSQCACAAGRVQRSG
ncbi:unnamed protein product [Scytosiphon promiscuus]